MKKMLLGRFWRSAAAVPIGLFLLGVGLAAAGGAWLHGAIHTKAEAEFARAAGRVSDDVAQRFRQSLYGLHGVRGLYAASGRVGRSEFRAYVESRDLARNFPGVRGFGFIERVPRAGLDEYQNGARRDGDADFAIHQLVDRSHDDLLVIRHIEPAARNAGAQGLDVGSEPVRRAAAQRAIDSGEPTLSGAITLVQDERRTPGVLLYVPVFAAGSTPSSVETRRASLVGLLYAPIVVAELLARMDDVIGNQVGFEVFDAAGTAAADRIFGTAPDRASEGAKAHAREPLFHGVRALSLPGRDLTLRVASTPRFDAALDRTTPWFAFGAGSLVSALLAVLMWQQASGRRRAEALARHMTADLHRLAQVVRHTSNAVSITDTALRITWINEGFTRTTGYTRDDALGKTPGELLGSGKADPAALQMLAGAATSGIGCRVEILNRAKDGHEFWIDTEIQPLLDARGELVGFMEIGTDVTARKRAEAALRASEAFLDKTGRIAGVGGWTFDFATQAIEWTDETCRIHDREPGYRPTLEEATGHYAADARSVIEAAMQAGIATGSGFDLELPLVTATGRPIWVRSVGEVECVDGQPRRLIGAFQDITARRAMEAELRRHGELVGSVIENLPCALSVFDADLKLVAENAEFRRLLEFPDTLFAGASTGFEDIIRFNANRGEYGSGDTEAAVRAIVERARAPAVAHQFERVRPDGTSLEVRGGPMPGGGFVTTYTDISARRRAEAEVQRSEQLLRGAIDAIDEAFVLYGPDDRLVFCNDKYRQIYHASAHMIVPGAAFEDIVRHGAERGHYPQAIGRVDEWVAERVAIHRAGDSSMVQQLADGRSLRIVERKMPDGHTVGFRIDITEMVRTTEAAQQASRAKSQFLANMSHEIRTPMNAILGMLALLGKTELTPRQADYATKTEGAARSLLGLLNDILDFSKVEAGKMTLDPQPFRIDHVLRDLAVILSANVGPKHLEVLFDVDPALPVHVIGDAMRLQQVLINLGGNAIKFTDEGEVVVSIEVVERSAAAVTLRVAVRDTGIGIAPENQTRIFSGFTQAEASTTRRFGGTGLGVAISQRLVGLMGGELGVDSALGHGSRFHFCITLPVAADATGPDLAEPLRALVVDDNPTARDVLSRMCVSLGWHVDVAESGEQALARLRECAAAGTAYEAVFVDWMMPGLDGWETSRRMRRLGLADTAPVIVMVTAHGREMLAQRSEADQATIDGFLVKPLIASMLRDAVAEARGGKPPLASPRPELRRERRLAAMKVLLVEDNPTNQQVARELLEDEGARVRIAGHGQAAIETLAGAETAFDVVLMDLQMPVMDGFTATSRIRQEFAPQDLPIVAMTANAMAADREACLAVGMNDHVGKPFDLNQLVHVLRRNTGRQSVGDGASDATDPALSAPVRDAAANAGVDLQPALDRLGGHRQVYHRMLTHFVADLADMPAQLEKFAGASDWGAARRLLHTLKGVAATLGATALSTLAADGEQQLVTPHTDDEDGGDGGDGVVQRTRDAIDAARPALALLAQALQPAASELGDSAPAAPDRATLCAALRAMAVHLQNADMAATDAMRDLQRDFGAVLGAQLEPMDDAVGALDFESALRLCHDLIESQRG